MQRFTVVIDDVDRGPYFLPHADTGMPQLFTCWEEANAAADLLREAFLPPTALCQVIRLQDG
jgi:hypothetical protein